MAPCKTSFSAMWVIIWVWLLLVIARPLLQFQEKQLHLFDFWETDRRKGAQCPGCSTWKAAALPLEFGVWPGVWLGLSWAFGFLKDKCLTVFYSINYQFFLLSLQDDSAPLTWEMRISISLGVVRAVEYLHNFGILHGNIKRWVLWHISTSLVTW